MPCTRSLTRSAVGPPPGLTSACNSLSGTTFPTLGGLEKFDEGGILTRKVYMIQIQHGRFIQLH